MLSGNVGFMFLDFVTFRVPLPHSSSFKEQYPAELKVFLEQENETFIGDIF